MRPSQKYPALFSVLLGLLATACGESGAPNPPPPTITPEALQIVSGNNQRTAISRPLAAPLRVRVIGSDDQPLAGATVLWSVTSVAGGQATLDPTQSTSDARGEAETRATLGTATGSIVISATVEDLAPVTFSITALHPSAFLSVSAGAFHTCAVSAAGDAYCWGANFYGQLGDGTTTDRMNPVAVLGGLSFSEVSAGHDYTCGVTVDGTAYCWGYNGFGRLGDGTTDHRPAPVPVTGSLSFAVVRAGVHTCGLTTSGAAYCWARMTRGARSWNGDRSYV